MAFQVNETLVLKNVDNRILGQYHYGLFKATTVEVDPDQSEDWTAVKTSESSYCHVALKEDRGWQVKLICRDIDGTVFPDDIEKVYVVEGDSWERFMVVDGQGTAYGFPAPSYGFSLLGLAQDLDERVSRGDVKRCRDFLFASRMTEADLVEEGMCVYVKPKQGVEQEVKPELNTVNLPCALSSGARVIGAEITGLYGIGVGTGEDGHGVFISREQAAELLESLLQFIEGGK